MRRAAVYKGGGYMIVRGCENLPIQIGAVTLPTAARMQTQRIAPRVFQPLEFVSIVSPNVLVTSRVVD